MNGIEYLQEKNYKWDGNSCDQEFKKVENTLGINKMVLSNKSGSTILCPIELSFQGYLKNTCSQLGKHALPW